LPGGVCLQCVAMPIAVVATEVYIADRFGSKRGGLLAPFIVSTMGGLLTIGSFGLLYFTSVIAPVTVSNLSRDQQTMAFTVMVATIGLGVVSMIGGPVLAYQLSAEDKLPGDVGQGAPGLWSPAQPMPPVAPPPTIGRVDPGAGY
jgi:hypothetical protein